MAVNGTFSIRDAAPADLEAIVGFNERLALESERKRLDRDTLRRGVRIALDQPDRLRYWVVESADRVLLGQAAITREWSDWRNGWVWWFQSVYVVPEARGRGVFTALHAHIRALAQRHVDVIGLRLYVEQDNVRAQATYQRLGLKPGGYQVYEELWPDRVTAARD